MKTSRKSAGILLFKRHGINIKVLLAHPGGPFWSKKDEGAWSIPKGEFDSEPPLEAALREFKEEIGFIPAGHFIELTPIRQSGGKWVFAWAVEGDCDVRQVRSNTFSMEWPPHSGKQQNFPEIDRAEWFSINEARRKILAGQLPLLEELNSKIGSNVSVERQ